MERLNSVTPSSVSNLKARLCRIKIRIQSQGWTLSCKNPCLNSRLDFINIKFKVKA